MRIRCTDVRRAEVAARLRDLREQRGREDAVRMEEEAAAEAERREQDERQRRREEEERTRAKLAIAAHRERKLEAAEQRLLLRVLLRWYSVGLLYEDKSTNTDTSGAACQARNARDAGDGAEELGARRLQGVRVPAQARRAAAAA